MLDRWLKDKASRYHFKSVLNLFREYAGCDSFEALLELEDPRGVLLRWMDGLDVTPGSVNAYVSRVKSFYRHFDVDLGKVKRLRNRVLNPHKVLTTEEIGLMIRHGGIRDKGLIWGLYSSGARIRSFLGLNVGRIPFRSETPVRLHFYPQETKFNVEYDTFLCAEAVEALKNYLRWRKRRGEKVEPTSPLFISKYGGRLNYQASRWIMKEIIGKAGIVLGPGERLAHHSFRAAFHRNLQVVGVNQYIIERLMGHSTELTTTGRYSIGLTPDDLRDAYMKAQWSLEVDETRVRELENRLGETERQLGAERVSKSMLDKRMEAMEKQIQLMQEYMRKQV